MLNRKRATVSKIVSGFVDVYVNRGNELKRVGLNVACGGAFDNPLNENVIPDGTVVTLRRGGITRKVVIIQEGASECTANFLELDNALARKFRLKNKTRFVLTYNTVTKTLTMRRKRITVDTLLLSANSKMRSDRVGIGLGLAIRDGNYLNGGELITLRNGKLRSKLHFVPKGNLFNDTFSINPSVIRFLGLTSNKRYRIAYNQCKRELVFKRQVAR